MFFFLSTIDANVFLSENLFMSSYYSRAEFVIVTIFIENIDLKKILMTTIKRLRNIQVSLNLKNGTYLQKTTHIGKN